MEPAWNSLVSSIAECTTIVEVLAKHRVFLCCLHNYLLSSMQLLATVKKLLSVCAEFAAHTQIVLRTLSNMLRGRRRPVMMK